MSLSKKTLKLFNEALSSKSTLSQSQKPRLRPSALPFCPILTLFEKAKVEVNPMELIQYGDEFYASVGTTVHALWQRHVVNHPTLGRYAWGCWKCPACERTKTNRRRPSLCKCGAPVQWSYVEPDLRFRNVVGHCDMFLEDVPEDGNILMDLKTTSLRNTTTTKHFLPVPKHKHQLRSYAVMLERLLNKRINKLIIVYHPRDTHDPKKFVYIAIPWNDKIRKMTVMHLNRAVEGSKAANEWWRNRKKVMTTSSLKDVIDYRPCTNRKEYDEYMKDGFFKERCPLYDNCVSSSRVARVPKIVLKTLKKELASPISLFEKEP